jgi:hypothetical protein
MDEEAPMKEKATNKRSAAQAKPASKGKSPKEQSSTTTKPARPRAVAKGSKMAIAAKADEAPGGGNVEVQPEVQPEQGNKRKSSPIDDEAAAASAKRTKTVGENGDQSEGASGVKRGGRGRGRGKARAK